MIQNISANLLATAVMASAKCIGADKDEGDSRIIFHLINASIITAKIKNLEMPCFSINPVNGSLQYFETTRNLVNPGDIFNVDVKVKNSAGEKIYKNYTTLKLGAKSRPFEFFWGTTAIILVNNAGQKVFTLYDNIAPTGIVRVQNVNDQNGKELINIYKKSDQPSTGIKILIHYLDLRKTTRPILQEQRVTLIRQSTGSILLKALW